MKRKVLESIMGIEQYPVFSLLVFFTVFTAMLIIVMTMKKSHAIAMGNMPLDVDSNEGSAGTPRPATGSAGTPRPASKGVEQ